MPPRDDAPEAVASTPASQSSSPVLPHAVAVRRRRRFSNAWVVLLICIGSVLAYANSFTGEFVFDDIDTIVENATLRSWDNLRAAFTTDLWAFRDQSHHGFVPPPLPYYRPLFTWMLTVEYHLIGLWPPGWHVVNLVLHILCSILVFLLIELLCANRRLALFTSLLFAVHPIHTQSVAWISGMTDPLFAVFFLASFLCYVRAHGGLVPPEHRRRGVYLTLSLLLFVVAAFSKETALSLIVLVFGYEFIRFTGGMRRRLAGAVRGTVPFVVASLVYLIPRWLVLGERMWTNPQAPERPLSATLLTLPFVLCSYLYHLLWPVELSLTYATRFVTSPASARLHPPNGGAREHRRDVDGLPKAGQPQCLVCTRPARRPPAPGPAD